MRIVGGALRGRHIDVPRGRTVRPTGDRVREALFSTLGGRVVGAVVLDLFAGSGALGLEALSRGAAAATFVERDRAAARVLKANIAALGLSAAVHVMDARRFVDSLGRGIGEPRYDLVLCDPPYGMATAEIVALLQRLGMHGHLAPTAMMVVERTRHGDAFAVPADIGDVADVRVYGDTVLYYVRRSTSAGEG